MSEWKEVRLGDIVTVKSGYAYKGKYISNKGKNILLGMGCVSYNDKFLYSGARAYDEDCDERYCAKAGDIVLATRQQSDSLPILAMPAIIPDSLFDKKIIVGTNLYLIKNDSDIDNHFLFWLLKTPNYVNYISSVKTGTTVRMVTKKDVENYIFKCPSKEERDTISNILWGIDAKIETNNKLNDKLEEMAQAIFKSWFVDFEPFKDKPFHETELGMIPEGWEVKRLCDIVDNIGGYSYKGNELKESTTAMCTIKNFERNGGFKIDGYKEIIPSDKLKASQELSLFDVVVAHTDLTQNAEVIGNPAIILSKSNYDRIIFSMDLTKVISKNMNVSKSLLYCILRNNRFKNHALGYVNGTTVLHMSKKAVPDYMLAFPKDSAILTSLSKCFDSIFGRMHEIYEENARLSSLRDTLLPRLMSGELIV